MSDADERRGALVVITGATRGLGRALAVEFAARGCTVVGCGRSPEDLSSLRAELGERHGFDEVDVADSDQVDAWTRGYLERFGTPDLVINNAGLINRNAPLWLVSAAEFDRVIDVNVKGVANVIRAVAPALIARGSGIIVNLSSGWGRSVSPDVATYCASKWAVEGLTRALAKELPSGLAAVSVNPGIIDTEMLRICYGEHAAQFPKPDAWARDAVPFLLQLGPKDNGKPLTVP